MSAVVDVAGSLAASRANDLDRLDAVLVLTDAAGVVVGEWGMGREVRPILDRAGVRMGHDVSEAVLGTSSVSTLVTRLPVQVDGSAHYSRLLEGVSSAGTTIVQAATRRVLGSLHLMVASSAASPLALLWVRELAGLVEREIRDRSGAAEQLLMERFLAADRGSRRAVVAVDERTIITNASAARIVGVEEQTVLWERARAVLAGEAPADARLEVGAVGTLRVQCEPVLVEQRPVGVVMRLRRIDAGRTGLGDRGMADELTGLVGDGAAWRALRHRLAAARPASTLVVGERGVGVAAVARSHAGPGAVVLDAADAVTGDALAWMNELAVATSGEAGRVVLVLNIDRLPTEHEEKAAAMLTRSAATVRTVATAGWVDGAVGGLGAGGVLPVTVRVPSLRERPEDIPDLVRQFTASYVARHRHLDGIQWMTDALQALSRLDWPENVRELRDVVHVVLSRAGSRYVTVRDLPAEVLAGTARRSLAGLERAEVGAILRALEEARGNKHQAACALGIARSTLYRKMRALGLDLEATSF
ncbi:helix-turn-helix domain-containing protein [Nocardioides zeae]|uniref:Helix-turn-helix domain-containing protein n=1 Tax=Nocardioides imazamoxiresistens TaxID=3231893 RepID=A0ABU3PTT6_9ACTN|nr:helix-turn-helix domain-containing protein [Nocardioides zeae]MDT9592215.1 helix-turn-helix domain-containing protein [Nocardioides zeae]